MSIKVLENESVEYNIYAVKSTLDEEIELNDDCRKASGFKDKFLAIGYAICLAENFDYTDVFVTENKTINNYWVEDDAVNSESIIWSCIKIEDDSTIDDQEITEETEELVDIDE